MVPFFERCVLWDVGMNLLVQDHNHCTTADGCTHTHCMYFVAQEREIEGMRC